VVDGEEELANSPPPLSGVWEQVLIGEIKKNELFFLLKMTKRRGLLIAVEGCDRGGKTTQCKHLQEWLSRHFSLPNEYVKFPGI
jgi:hypothetical protein